MTTRVNNRMIDGATVNVLDFGVIGDGIADDTVAIQTALNSLSSGDALYFPNGIYGLTSMVTCNTSNITIFGESKYTSILTPITGWDGSDGLMSLGDGTTTARQVVRDLAFQAAVGSLANDTDGLIVHPFFNLDLYDIRVQGGNYTTRECAGLRIKDGRHTRVYNSQFHNSFCHGMLVERHLTGLNIIGNAFDESDTGIKTLGTVLEANISHNEFGSSRANPSFPAPTNAINIDMDIGNHDRIAITSNIFSGGGGTDYHVRWSFCDHMIISANLLSGAGRYSLARSGGSLQRVTITGNTFKENGETGTTDPTTGTQDVDTTPYLSDIFIRSAFNKPTSITGNNTSKLDKPMAWIEGTSGGLATSAVQLVGNGTEDTDIAYVHLTSIPKNNILMAGSLITP